MFHSKFSAAVGEFQAVLKLEGEHHPWALAHVVYTAGAVAEAYVGLGDKDRAIHWLAKANRGNGTPM